MSTIRCKYSCALCGLHRVEVDVPERDPDRQAPIAGVPCRVCGETDDDERAQADLHTRCVELAAHRAKAKRRVLRHHRELTHDQLVAKLARARAAAPQPDEPEAVVADHDLTHDELGPGALATEGLS